MLKKMIVLAVVGFVAVAAISGTKLASYFRSEYKSFREEAEANVPPEKEIARLKNEVSLLDGDIKKLVNQLAKERVEVNQLKDKVDDLASKQGKDKELLLARGEAIKKSEGQVTFGTRTMSVEAAKLELAEGAKRFTANQKTLSAHEALLANRMKVRDSLEKQLEVMKNQKSEQSAAIETLEAELAMLKLQQVESKYQNDETRLAKIKEDVRKLKTKMDVQREELKLMPSVLDEAPAKTGNTTGDVDDILSGINGPKPEAPKATKKPE